MADENGGTQGKNQLFIMLIGVLLVGNLIVGGLNAWKLMALQSQIVAAVPKVEEPEKAEEGLPPPGPVVALEPVVVNLKDPGKPRYLKAGFEFEAADELAAKDIEIQKRLIRDEIFRYLSSLTLVDTTGEEGKASIQAEVKKRAEQILGPDRLRRVFFQEFVTQ